MLSSLKNNFKVPDLRNKVVFTLLIIGLYQLGANLIVPFVSIKEINLLESVGFFLEPLSDGSLPAYNIQRELFAALARLPVNKDSLIASGRKQLAKETVDWTTPVAAVARFLGVEA